MNFELVRVDEQLKHVPVTGKIDTSIVNPAHLSPRLADETCMYCHEFGEARVRNLERSMRTFFPGLRFSIRLQS